MKKTLFIAVALLMLFPVGVNAIPVDPSDWTGSRSTAVGGVVATGAWSGTGNNGFQIEWQITKPDTTYSYTYTISGEGVSDLSKELSHWILEVTYPSSAGDFTNQNPSIAEGPKWFYPTQGGSNPDMPADIYGIKWEQTAGALTVSFDTFKDPVWGDFYAKDGCSQHCCSQNCCSQNCDGSQHCCMWAIAYNSDFGNDPTPGDFTGWIPTPNSGAPPIPEPATLLLLGSGLAGIGLFGRKRFRK